MDALRGGVVQKTLPDHVREDLRDVDHLRKIWTLHRGPRSEREVARQEQARRRSRELGGGDAQAEMMAAIGSEEMSGRPITATYVTELAQRTTGPPKNDTARPATPPFGAEQAERLAEAAALPEHPVVRATHTYLICVEALSESGSDTDPSLLPWLLASLVLQRADFPPLLPPPSKTGRIEQQRFPEAVRRFVRLVHEALRTELSRSPTGEHRQHATIPPLAAALRRRILEHLRSRRDSVLPILRSLDPGAQAGVHTGGSVGTPSKDPGQGPAARCLLTPGSAHWWNTLELALGTSFLPLYVVVQEVGHTDTGVLSVTVDAQLTSPEGVRDALLMDRADDVTVMPNDSVDDRWPQVRELVDEAISRAMDQLTRG